MKPPEAARILDLHPRTIRAMIRDRRLRGTIIRGCRRDVYLVDPDHVRELRRGFGGDVESESQPEIDVMALRQAYGQKTHPR